MPLVATFSISERIKPKSPNKSQKKCYHELPLNNKFLTSSTEICQHRPQQKRCCCVSKAKLSAGISSVHLCSTDTLKSAQHAARFVWCCDFALCLFSILLPALLIWSLSGLRRGCQRWQSALNWSQPKLKTLRRRTIQLRDRRRNQIKRKKQNSAFCLYGHVPVVRTEVLAGASSPVLLHYDCTICNTKHQFCVVSPFNV